MTRQSSESHTLNLDQVKSQRPVDEERINALRDEILAQSRGTDTSVRRRS